MHTPPPASGKHYCVLCIYKFFCFFFFEIIWYLFFSYLSEHNALKVHPCRKWQDFLLFYGWITFTRVCARMRACVHTRMCPPCSCRALSISLSSSPRATSDSPDPKLAVSRGSVSHFAHPGHFRRQLPSHELRGHCQLPFSVACPPPIKAGSPQQHFSGCSTALTAIAPSLSCLDR